MATMTDEEVERIALKIIELTSQQNYVGFADTKEFLKISGISEWDFKQKVLYHPEFKNAMYQFDGSRKHYIHINKGLKALERIMA